MNIEFKKIGGWMTSEMERLENGESSVQKYGKYSWLFLLLLVLSSTKCTFENSEEMKEREIFQKSLGAINRLGVESIRLSEITKFEWETVCDVHPYWGDLYLKQYDRTYRGPGSQAHDRNWVLVFIEHNGKPKYMWPAERDSESIKTGQIDGVLIKRDSPQQCFSKEEAVLNKIEPYYNWPQYQLESEFPE
ncbi:MAG: hypothetical protein V2B20_15485 [Pseudomonadota bacterium]